MIEASLRRLLVRSLLIRITLSISFIISRGIVTSISKNAKWDKKENTYCISHKDKYIQSHIEGEFTSFLKFDTNIFWEYSQYNFPKFLRMAYTLPSDSTFREDLIWFKKGDEDIAQRFKIKLEEIQRKDKKLREVHEKKHHRK
jgi:hypothetical protein